MIVIYLCNNIVLSSNPIPSMQKDIYINMDLGTIQLTPTYECVFVTNYLSVIILYSYSRNDIPREKVLYDILLFVVRNCESYWKLLQKTSLVCGENKKTTGRKTNPFPGDSCDSANDESHAYLSARNPFVIGLPSTLSLRTKPKSLPIFGT